MFRKYRRGQIRGIDFSLSMIIFMLTMSQILILTSNFIASSRIYQDSIERVAFAEGLANDMLYSEGINSLGLDWLGTSTANLGIDWNFGLSSTGNINPYKLGRLSNWSLSSMRLDYSTIESGLNLDGKLFSITIRTPINITITSVDTNTNIAAVVISGQVTLTGRDLENANIHIFGISAETTPIISEVESITDITGGFTASLDMTGVTTGTDITYIVVAKYGSASQGVDIFQDSYGLLDPYTNGEISIFETSTISEGYSVNLTSSKTIGATAANGYAFSAGNNQLSVNYTSSPMIDKGFWEADDFQIPQIGITVFITHEFRGANLVNINVLTFPIIIDGIMGKLIEPTVNSNAQSAVSLVPFKIRGIIMEYIVTTWEV